MPIPYGTHHTKMMLLFYNDDSMKLIIHTANLIQRDWTDKCQGLFISPLLFKKKAGQIASVFEKDIVQYFRAYKNVQIAKMVLRLQSFDFSPIKVI